MGRLDDKVALITGTAGGMGRAAALLFAREGARVAGCDLKEQEAAETVRLVRDEGGEMVSQAPVDLSTEEGARDWVEWAVGELGAIDVLFNNASASRVGAYESLTADDWHFTLRNELDIVHFVTAVAWPHLIARGGGSIINTASVAARVGAAFYEQAAHGAAKGGVLSYTYHLAASGGRHGIRANAILPGMIRTPQTEFLFHGPDAPAERLASLNPLGRIGYPEDVATVALFLASDESAYVNAAEIRVDGGQTVIT